MRIARSVVSLFLSSALILSSNIPAAYSAEDIYYLQKEIEEQQRILLPIADSARKMEEFLFMYPMWRENFADAHKELSELENSLKLNLRNNLVKSTIFLGIDTIGKIEFVVGLYLKSLKVIALSVMTQVAGDYMQNAFSTPYGGAVMSLSKEVEEAMPELQKFQFMLSLSAGEWRALMRTTGEFGDDDEKGMLYRRFHDILEETDKHKKKLEKLVRELDSSHETIKNEYPGLAEQRDALEKKIKGLQERLAAASEEKKKEEIDAALEAAQNAAGKQKVPPVPPLVFTGKREQDYEAWKVKYDQLAPMFESQIPPLFEEITKGREKIAEDETEALNSMIAGKLSGGYNGRSQSYYGTYFDLPDEVNPAVEYSITQIVEIHYSSKYSKEFYMNWKSDIAAARKSMAGLEREGSELAVKEKRMQELLKQGSDLADEYRRIMGEGIDQKRSVLWLFMKLIPGYVNYNREMTGLGYVAKAASTDGDLEVLENNLPQAIEISDKNEKTTRKMFEDRKKFFDETLAKFQEAHTNMENAFDQMEGTAFGYDNLVTQSGWAAARRSSENEFYFSTAKGNLTSILGHDFSQNKFGSDLIDGMKRGDFAGAGAIMKKYYDLRDRCESLNNKYVSARGNYYYYAESGMPDSAILYDMDYASRMAQQKDLDVPSLSKKDNERIQGGMAKFAPVFRTLPELPEITVDPASPGGRALRLYQIHETIEKDKSAWLNLDAKAFFAKMGEVGSELEKASEGGELKIPAANIQEELSQLGQEWYKMHPQTVVTGTEGEGEKEKEKPVLGKESRNFLNGKINGKSAESVSGNFLVMKTDLTKGIIEVSGKIDNMKGVKKLSISEDGVTWRDIPAKADIKYAISPVPDKYYRPGIRLKMEDGTEERIDMFPQLAGIVYKDVDVTRLVVEAVQLLAESYEARNASRFMDIVSRDFLGNRVYLEEGVRFDFDMFSDIRLSIFINKIDQGKDTYTAETKWDKTQTPRKTGSQQRTSGNTTLVFAMEDGKMKLKNMRGNLIYATLSPEIAESSGLSQQVVQEIKVAQNERLPVQPGAGETEESGGVTASNIETGNISMTQSAAHPPMTNEAFVFSSRQKISESDFALIDATNGDFKRREGWLIVRSGNGVKDMGAVDINSITEVPASGYASGPIGMNESSVYAISISDGTYALIKATSSNWGVWPMTTNYQYKYQKARTRSFK